MNLLPEKKYRVPSWNFLEKNVLCEKGDEITRFDGIALFEKIYDGEADFIMFSLLAAKI